MSLFVTGFCTAYILHSVFLVCNFDFCIHVNIIYAHSYFVAHSQFIFVNNLPLVGSVVDFNKLL